MAARYSPRAPKSSPAICLAAGPACRPGMPAHDAVLSLPGFWFNLPTEWAGSYDEFGLLA